MRSGTFTAVVLTAALALATPAAAGAPKVQGKVTVEGTVIAVSSAASMFILRVASPGHALRAGSATMIVLVLQATVYENGIHRRATIGDVRVGDRVKLEGFRLDDGRVLALRLDVKNRAAGGSGPTVPDTVANGVVTAKGSNTLIVTVGDTAPRAILITPATEFRGLRDSFWVIQPGDFVSVQGSVNSDGSVVARRVDTTLGGGTTLRGRISAKSTVGPAFLILDNRLAVNISSETQILSGGQLRSAGDLYVGQAVTVTGTLVTIRGVTVGINARLITY